MIVEYKKGGEGAGDVVLFSRRRHMSMLMGRRAVKSKRLKMGEGRADKSLEPSCRGERKAGSGELGHRCLL